MKRAGLAKHDKEAENFVPAVKAPSSGNGRAFFPARERGVQKAANFESYAATANFFS
jgi:hypothetical protein